METKNLIIIGILAIILCILAGALFGALTNNVAYERIEMTPNGTSIEVPVDDAKYDGEINETGARLWSFKQGTLMSFNSDEAINARGLYGLGGAMGLKSAQDMVLNHFDKREEIDGYTVYTLDGAKLGIEGRGTLYCIILGNDTTHDNIIITTDNKDITLHMAKSIKYKNASVTSNEESSQSSVSVSNGNNTNKYSEADLAKASAEGYDLGYSDASLDYDIDDMDSSSSSSSDSSNVESTTDDSSSSSSGSSNVETTTDSD